LFAELTVTQRGAAPHTGAVMLVLRTSLVAALVAGVLAAGGCSSSQRCPPGASCPATVPKVTFTPTINGVSFALRKDGHVPRYQGRPGETLVMRVAVTVPKQVTITALWFGLSSGTWGGGPNGPIGMNPILAHYRQVLPTGSHTFGLHWRIPHRRSHTNWSLTYSWSSNQPSASVSGPIATLALPSTSTGS
jgi:hypothetical protein